MRLRWMRRPRAFVPVAVIMILGISGGLSSRSATPSAAPSVGQRSPRQVILIDPATGQPRELTAAEWQALQGPSTPAAPPIPIVSEVGGLEGLQLSEDQMVYTVATKTASGKIVVREMKGRRDADRTVIATSREGLRAGQEAGNDR